MPNGRETPRQPVIYRQNVGRFSLGELVRSTIDSFFLDTSRRLTKRHLADRRKQLVVFSFDWIATNINLSGVYELDQLSVFSRWIAPYREKLARAAAIDIGANIGNHSLYFSDMFRKIYSFEPNKRTFKLLELNAELAPNVVCFNVGISDKDCEALLNVDRANAGGSAISAQATATTHAIALRRLEPFIDPADDIALIKIDVEGHEFLALTGSAEVIRKHKPIILFEQHRDEFSGGSTKTIDLLRDLGYAKFAVIDTEPKTPASLPRPLRVLWRMIAKFLFGTTTRLVVKERFEPGFYSFIIAIPDWVTLTEI